MIDADEALLNEHLAAENANDLERIMRTYSPSPLIELNGVRVEGIDAVREFHRSFGFAGAGGSFSEVHVAERSRHRAEDAFILEQTLTGRHTGNWRGVPPTGRAVSIAVCTVYVFVAGRLAIERVYLDEGRLRHVLTRADARPRLRSTRDVILRTPKFDDAVRFYETAFGLVVTLRQANLVGFESGAFQLFVERGEPAHGAVFEVCAEDAPAAARALVAAGCVIVEEDPKVPRRYLRDPYGLVFNLAGG